MDFYSPPKPSISLDELEQTAPDEYNVITTLLHGMALKVYDTNEELRRNGLECIFEDILSLYKKGLVKLIYDEGEDGFSFKLGVFNPLTGIYS